MKKISIPFMMLGLLLSFSCKAQETGDTLATFMSPDLRPHVHQKMVTIYLAPRLLQGTPGSSPRYGFLLFDSNGDIDTTENFTTYFVYEWRNNKPGVIMWQPVSNSGARIDRIAPKDPDNSEIFEGAMDGPPFVITLSKQFLDSLSADTLSHVEEYIIEWSLHGQRQSPIDPPIDIRPPDE